MGNNASDEINTKQKSLTQTIDYIATRYILTQNFKDMEKLADTDYCNKLVILTSDLIAKNLQDKEITFLAQRMENNVEINDMKKDNIIFLKKAQLESLDISNPTMKRRACIGIAKFYVLVAHLFSAIVKTINPIYTYKDANNTTITTSLLNKQDIPKDVKPNVKKMNLCSQRINALLNNR